MQETVIVFRPQDRAWNPGAVDGLLGAVVMGRPEVSYNTNRTDDKGRKLPDGIELRFGDARPTEQVRAKLKEHGFRFSEKQVLWYAKDNAKSRELIDSLETEEWEIDTTIYEKHSFWAAVRNMGEYENLRGRVEFMVAGTPPAFYNSKRQLEASESPRSLVGSRRLKFKKYYSRPAGDEGDGGEGSGGEGGEPGGGEIPGRNDGKGEREAKDNETVARTLEKAALAMQSQIDQKRNPPIARQPYTPRRQHIIEGLASEARTLERTQSVLLALSKVWHQDRIEEYPFLRNIRSRGQVETLVSYAIHKRGNHPQEAIQRSFENSAQKLKSIGLESPHAWAVAFEQVEAILGSEAPAPDPSKVLEQEIAAKIAKIRGLDIPGFFPTPDKEVDRMIELAGLRPGDRVLDPSAGIGSILDRVATFLGGEKSSLEAIEINSSLREILELKGYNLTGRDFMAQKPPSDERSRPDRILMNPPFENGLDIEHVRHALGFLGKGGRLVAIMGEGAFFRKRDGAFRRLLEARNAWVSEPMVGAFKSSFNPTGATVRMVVVNQDGSRPLIGGREITDSQQGNYWSGDRGGGDPDTEERGRPMPDFGDMDMLELEALAELELMEMEAEAAKARARLDGLGPDREKLRAIRRMALAITDRSEVLDFK